MWPDWAIFESSWWQIFFLKKPKCRGTLRALFKDYTCQVETNLATFWATLGKIGLFFTSISGHTGYLSTKQESSVLYTVPGLYFCKLFNLSNHGGKVLLYWSQALLRPEPWSMSTMAELRISRSCEILDLQLPKGSWLWGRGGSIRYYILELIL